MARSTSDTNESRRRFSHLAAIFTVVIERYRDLVSLHPLAASQIDSEAPQNRKLDFNALNYKIDIENACTDAIKGQANEEELKDVIDRLIAGDQSVPETLARQAIRLCASVLEARGLEPARYGSRKRVTP